MVEVVSQVAKLGGTRVQPRAGLIICVGKTLVTICGHFALQTYIPN